MPLLPKIEAPISPGKIGLPFDTMNPQSINRQLMRAMRQARGFRAYELTVAGSEEKANFLAGFGNLNKDDAEDEAKLSDALDCLILTVTAAIDEAVAIYDEKDHGILKAIAAKQLKRVLAHGLKDIIEEADAQLADLRKEVA